MCDNIPYKFGSIEFRLTIKTIKQITYFYFLNILIYKRKNKRILKPEKLQEASKALKV